MKKKMKITREKSNWRGLLILFLIYLVISWFVMLILYVEANGPMEPNTVPVLSPIMLVPAFIIAIVAWVSSIRANPWCVIRSESEIVFIEEVKE